jgi:hypothetical protein
MEPPEKRGRDAFTNLKNELRNLLDKSARKNIVNFLNVPFADRDKVGDDAWDLISFLENSGYMSANDVSPLRDSLRLTNDPSLTSIILLLENYHDTLGNIKKRKRWVFQQRPNEELTNLNRKDNKFSTFEDSVNELQWSSLALIFSIQTAEEFKKIMKQSRAEPITTWPDGNVVWDLFSYLTKDGILWAIVVVHVKGQVDIGPDIGNLKMAERRWRTDSRRPTLIYEYNEPDNILKIPEQIIIPGHVTVKCSEELLKCATEKISEIGTNRYLKIEDESLLQVNTEPRHLKKDTLQAQFLAKLSQGAAVFTSDLTKGVASIFALIDNLPTPPTGPMKAFYWFKATVEQVIPILTSIASQGGFTPKSTYHGSCIIECQTSLQNYLNNFILFINAKSNKEEYTICGFKLIDMCLEDLSNLQGIGEMDLQKIHASQIPFVTTSDYLEDDPPKSLQFDCTLAKVYNSHILGKGFDKYNRENWNSLDSLALICSMEAADVFKDAMALSRADRILIGEGWDLYSYRSWAMIVFHIGKQSGTKEISHWNNVERRWRTDSNRLTLMYEYNTEPENIFNVPKHINVKGGELHCSQDCIRALEKIKEISPPLYLKQREDQPCQVDTTARSMEENSLQVQFLERLQYETKARPAVVFTDLTKGVASIFALLNELPPQCSLLTAYLWLNASIFHVKEVVPIVKERLGFNTVNLHTDQGGSWHPPSCIIECQTSLSNYLNIFIQFMNAKQKNEEYTICEFKLMDMCLADRSNLMYLNPTPEKIVESTWNKPEIQIRQLEEDNTMTEAESETYPKYA